MNIKQCIMNVKIIENVATKLYADYKYELKDMVEERSDAIAWLCEPSSQKKLDEMGMGDDEIAVLKFTKKIIYYKWFIYRTRVKKHYINLIDHIEQWDLDGLLYDNYSTTNETECLKFDYENEIKYMLDNLKDKEVELLVDLCSDVTYQDMVIKYQISYANLKMRIMRLRKRCKQLYNEGLDMCF